MRDKPIRVLMLFLVFYSFAASPRARAATDADWKPVFTERSPSHADEAASEMTDNLKKLINLDYKDADLSSVLRSMAWTYKLNIVTSSDVKGKVSINLQNIAVEEALKAISPI